MFASLGHWVLFQTPYIYHDLIHSRKYTQVNTEYLTYCTWKSTQTILLSNIGNIQLSVLFLENMILINDDEPRIINYTRVYLWCVIYYCVKISRLHIWIGVLYIKLKATQPSIPTCYNPFTCFKLFKCHAPYVDSCDLVM